MGRPRKRWICLGGAQAWVDSTYVYGPDRMRRHPHRRLICLRRAQARVGVAQVDGIRIADRLKRVFEPCRRVGTRPGLRGLRGMLDRMPVPRRAETATKISSAKAAASGAAAKAPADGFAAEAAADRSAAEAAAGKSTAAEAAAASPLWPANPPPPKLWKPPPKPPKPWADASVEASAATAAHMARAGML